VRRNLGFDSDDSKGFVSFTEGDWSLSKERNLLKEQNATKVFTAKMIRPVGCYLSLKLST